MVLSYLQSCRAVSQPNSRTCPLPTEETHIRFATPVSTCLCDHLATTCLGCVHHGRLGCCSMLVSALFCSVFPEVVMTEHKPGHLFSQQSPVPLDTCAPAVSVPGLVGGHQTALLAYLLCTHRCLYGLRSTALRVSLC